MCWVGVKVCKVVPNSFTVCLAVDKAVYGVEVFGCAAVEIGVVPTHVCSAGIDGYGETTQRG